MRTKILKIFLEDIFSITGSDDNLLNIIENSNNNVLDIINYNDYNIKKFTNNWTIHIKKIPKYPEFKNIVFIENYDINILNDILNSKDPIFSDLHKKMLNDKIFTKINKSNNNIYINYYQVDNIGRFYSNNASSMLTIPRVIKHTIFESMNWIDIDISKSYPTIIYEMGKINKLDFSSVYEYINNFDEILKMFNEFYSDKITKQHIKSLFNNALFGGTFNTWLHMLLYGDESILNQQKYIYGDPEYVKANIFNKESIIKEVKSYKEHPFFIKYLEEINKFRELVIKNNDEIKTNLSTPYSISLIWELFVKDYTKITKKELENKIVHYFLGIIENNALYVAYNYLVEKGIIVKGKCILEFDGLCLPPVSKSYNIDNMIMGLNEHILKVTGIAIQFVHKPYSLVCNKIVKKYKKRIL